MDANTGVGLGYSYSEPQVYKYQPPGTAIENAIPVMITGNGYGCDGTNALSDRLLMVDLASGSILANLETGESHGGLSTPVIYARQNATRAVYAGDLGGNVWRFKPPSSTDGDWSVSKLWSFGSPITGQLNVSMCQNVPVILGGTGKYLETDDVTESYDNYIFAIRDLNGTGEGWWKITLSGGERVKTSPEVVWGEAWFVTMTPTGDVCSQGGSSRMFRVTICPSVDEDTYSGGDGTWQFLESDLLQPPDADPDDPNPDTRPQMEAYSLPWMVLSNPRTIEDEQGNTAIVVQGSITGEDETGGAGAESFDVKSGKSRPRSLQSWQMLRWMQNLNQ
jgi:Tfp pilus tip-associated adhesin PilY1